MKKNEFNEIFSLGYNCEVSFRLKEKFEVLPSYIFSWTFCLDKKLFLDSLKYDFKDIISGENIVFNYGMVEFSKYKLKFHCDPQFEKELSEEHSKEFEDKVLEETISKVLHLKEKTLKLFSSGKRILFAIKIDSSLYGDYDTELFILDLFSILKRKVKNKKFLLVVVLKEEDYLDKFKKLTNSRLRIEKVKFFPSNVDVAYSGDFDGWGKILSDYELKEKIYFKESFKNFFTKTINFFKKCIKKVLSKMINFSKRCIKKVLRILKIKK